MTGAQLTIKASFFIWISAVAIAVIWPSFAHPGRAYTVWSVALLAGLPVLSLVATLLKFKTLTNGVRILGLLPPVLLAIDLLLLSMK